MKAIINTDIWGDFDDLLALLLALNSPEIDIQGVITTKEHVREKAAATKKLLRIAGRSDIPVFYSGEQTKSRGSYINVYDYQILTEAELEAADSELGISPDGVDFIVKTITRNPDEITIVSLAPNTSISDAMKKCPEIIPKIRAIHAMATALDTDANLGRPEHNYVKDRDAFYYMASQGIPVYLVPRDITHDLFLGSEVLEQKAKQSELYHIVVQMARTFLSHMQKTSFRLADPITMGSVLFPDIYQHQKCDIVRKKGENGEVALASPNEQGTVRVYHNFDRTEFYKRLVGRL